MGFTPPAPVTTATGTQLIVDNPTAADAGKQLTATAAGRAGWAAGGGGGGVAGHVETWASPTSYSGNAGGEGGLDLANWDMPYHPGGGEGLPASDFHVAFDRLYLDAPGYYLVTVWTDAMWAAGANAPSWARLAYNCGPTLGGNSETYVSLPTDSSGYTSLSQVISLGLCHSDGSAYLAPLVRWEGGKDLPQSFAIGAHFARLS